MAEIKQYKGKYTGSQIDDLLGRVPTIEQRVATLERGGADAHAEFAFYNKTSFLCPHNLGKKPAVTILDSGGDMILADVRHKDDNNLEVIFGMNVTGRVILN